MCQTSYFNRNALSELKSAHSAELPVVQGVCLHLQLEARVPLKAALGTWLGAAARGKPH